MITLLALAGVALVALVLSSRRRRSVPSHSPEYIANLRSAHWRRLRQRILAECGHRCEGRRSFGRRCRSRGPLQLHHLRYRDANGSILGRETRLDVLMLCSSCHHRADAVRRRHDW